MTQLLRRCVLIAVVLLGAAVALAQPFRVDTVARAPQAQYPMSIAFAPDGSGKTFFAEKNSGSLRMIAREALRAEPMATFPVEGDGEQGFLGLAIDPLYPDSPFVYVLYVRPIDRSTVVERYRDSSGMLIDRTPLLIAPRIDDHAAHIGGDIAFGPDGMLYAAIGDHQADPARAQDLTSKRSYWGKILRLEPDGGIPEDNPFPLSPVWAYGLCNPTGLAFDSERGDVYCVDAEVDGRNEINRVPRGANLGWPDREEDANYRLLILEGKSSALTGITYYRGSAFPRLRGTLLFGGHQSPTLMAGRFTAARDSLVTEEVFTTNAGFADVEEGPDGTIYLVNGPYISSRILRLAPVRPSLTSLPPTEAVQDSTFIYTPEFEGTPPALSVLEGPDGLSVDTTSWSLRWTPTNLQALEGEHRVRLRAENGGGSDEQSFTIRVANVNDPPLPFGLGLPVEEAYLEVPHDSLVLTFTWETAEDPDKDSLWYVLEIDTGQTFVQPMVRDTVLQDSATVTLPALTRLYHWRVRATDGMADALSVPPSRRLILAALGPLAGLESPALAEPAGEEETVLEQNFPNPFNPLTSIKYTVPRPGRVRLSVFNLLGQEVGVVLDAEQAVGVHTVEFDKADLPSGIYFYRLQGPGFFETKKMIIAK